MKNLNSGLCLVALISLLTAVPIKAQNIEAIAEKPITKQTVESQMTRIFSNSANQNDVKMVRKTDLEALRSDVLTLLSRNENDLSASKAAIEVKKAEIKGLMVKVDEANAKVSTSNTGSDMFLLLGMPVSKTLYHSIMWTLVLTLSVFAVFLIARFKTANRIARDAKGKVTEVEDEFELFKRNAIEREQKLRRQLQDEINKQKKMLVDVS